MSAPVRDDDRAPRWLVRWIQTALLLLVLVGLGFAIWWYSTAGERRDRAEQCAMTKRLDPTADCR